MLDPLEELDVPLLEELDALLLEELDVPLLGELCTLTQFIRCGTSSPSLDESSTRSHTAWQVILGGPLSARIGVTSLLDELDDPDKAARAALDADIDAAARFCTDARASFLAAFSRALSRVPLPP